MPEIDHIFIVMHHPPFIEDEFEVLEEGPRHPEASNMWCACAIRDNSGPRLTERCTSYHRTDEGG